MMFLVQRSLFMFIHLQSSPTWATARPAAWRQRKQFYDWKVSGENVENELRWVGSIAFWDHWFWLHIRILWPKQKEIKTWNISSVDNLSKTVASTVSRPSLESLSFDARRTSWTWHDQPKDVSAWEDDFLWLCSPRFDPDHSKGNQTNIRRVSFKYKNTI